MNTPKKKIAVILSTVIATLFLIFTIILFYSGYFPFVNQKSPLPCATYDGQKRIIIVVHECTLFELHGTINDDRILKRESSEGTWFLNSSILVSKGARLTVKDTEAKWIKISSEGKSIFTKEPESPYGFNESSPYFIQIFGKIDLTGVKISSWDPFRNNYTNQKNDGSVPRPYITVGSGAGPSQIAYSEIAYLGFNSSRKQGLSFYGGDHSALIGNKIHDLWYGFFSSNVSQITIANNSVFNNFRYGIDPHLLSHDMVVKENHIYNNRVGLICSLECSNMIFEDNSIDNNKEIGLMLSRNTIDSILRYNNISKSDVGISVSESHSNRIYDNNIMATHDALAIKNNASNNVFSNNTISHPMRCGVIVTTGSQNNTIEENYIQNYNKSGICLANGANQNMFYSNEIDGAGLFGIDVKDQAQGNRFNDNMIRIANNAIRIYNNSDTLFTNNKIGNAYNYQYIISGNSALNLADTRFLGDRIRSAGSDLNKVTISNSGIVDVMTSSAERNYAVTDRYDTDKAPYFANLSSVTIKLYSRNK